MLLRATSFLCPEVVIRNYLKSLAISLGVPAEHIICEEKAGHTFENAEFSSSMLIDMGIVPKKIILVCKSYHSRRALISYQCVFPKDTAFLVSSITDKNGLNQQNWASRQEYVDKVMSEVEKISKYFKDKIVKSGR